MRPLRSTCPRPPVSMATDGPDLLLLFGDETSARHASDGAFVDDAPFAHCLLDLGATTVGCANLRDRDFLMLQEGQLVAPVLHKDIAPRTCPVDSAGAQCADDFMLWQEVYGLGLDVDTTRPPPSSGGCASTPGPAMPIFLLLLTGLRRRRSSPTRARTEPHPAP